MSKYILLVLITVTMSGSAFGQVSSNIRSNGVNWMRYGPGIITSCKSIKIYMRDGETQHNVVINDHKRVQNIKKWIISYFGDKLSYSPVTPFHKAVVCPNVIALFAEEEVNYEYHLLSIPINPLTLDCPNSDDCKDKFNKTIRELKELIDKQ